MVILEHIIEGKLVYVAHFNLAFLTHDGWLFIEDVAIVPEGLVARQGGYLLSIIVDGPYLVVLILINEGTHANCDLYSFVLLHVNEYNGLYLRVVSFELFLNNE